MEHQCPNVQFVLLAFVGSLVVFAAEGDILLEDLNFESLKKGKVAYVSPLGSILQKNHQATATAPHASCHVSGNSPVQEQKALGNDLWQTEQPYRNWDRKALQILHKFKNSGYPVVATILELGTFTPKVGETTTSIATRARSPSA